VECQLDFARMGLVYDPGQGRRRVAHALIFTAVYSRHMFVWLTFTQTLAAVVAGVRGRVAVLRRGVRRANPRQRAGDRGRRRPGQPAVHGGLAGLRPALRVRHGPGPGPARERQAQGRAQCPICTREPVRRGGVRRPGRRAGARGEVVRAGGRAAGARHHPGPAGRGVRRGRGRPAAAGTRAVRRADPSAGSRYAATSSC